MSERVLKCPQCNAPLPPSRFARAVTCSFCGASVQVDPTAVFAVKFRRAHRHWNEGASPEGARSTLGDATWSLGGLLAHGAFSDVYFAQRARWPTESVVFKVLRDPGDLPVMEAEHAVLRALHARPGASPAMTARIPEPVQLGTITSGAHASHPALVLRWAPGFRHTFEAVRGFHPGGVPPRASIWLWRRVLEVLAFLHQGDVLHGAVLPPHLLVEQGEHGVRLVGYGCAGAAPEAPLRAVFTRWQAFYPSPALRSKRLRAADDVRMSARCVAHVLGGAPDGSGLPEGVPGPLAQLVREAAADDSPAPLADAWTLRQQVGRLGTELYGAPAFVPLVLPA